MIENRARIENQIYLGRMAARKPATTKKPNAHLPQGSTSTAPPATGSDLPLSVDSEAEAAFANAIRHPLRRVQDNSPQDHLRTSVTRRRWASNNTETDIKHLASPRSSTSLLARLRTKSFPSITSPFSHTKKEQTPVDGIDQKWSSDSSFEDDIDEMGFLRTGTTYLLSDEDV